MAKLKWSYVKPLKEQDLISNFEKAHNLKIPKDLKQCIFINNGGRPNLNVFDTAKTGERVFKTLLSFNEDDTENIYKIFPIFGNNTQLLPFASDPSGNFICVNLQTNNIVLWLHETNEKELIASSFEEFLDKLYD